MIFFSHQWLCDGRVKSQEYLFSASWCPWSPVSILLDHQTTAGQVRAVCGGQTQVCYSHTPNTHYFYRTNLNKTQHEVPSDQWEKQISSLFIMGKRRTHFDLFVVGRRMTHSGIPVWLLRDWTHTSYRQSVGRSIIWWGTWKWRKLSLEVRNTKDFNNSQS